MKNFQTFLYPLKSPTFAPNASDTVSLDSIPSTCLAGITHVLGFLFVPRLTPALTTAPTTQVQMNNLNARITINNGFSNVFDGNFNSARLFEMAENGKLLSPDADAAANGAIMQYARYIPLGPTHFAGSPTDFVFPAAAMRSGSIAVTWNAVTGLSADTTAWNSAVCELYAVCCGIPNEIRVPPAFERQSYAFGTSELIIQGRAAYATLAMQSGNTLLTPTAITAGQIGNVTIDTGRGSLYTVTAQALTQLQYLQSGSGIISELAGEPLSATTDSPKSVNIATPTALVGSVALCQSLVYSGPDMRISKLMVRSDSGLRVRWSGTLTSGMIHAARILSQSQSARAAIAARAVDELKLKIKDFKVKTLSKTPYDGPDEDLMPWTVKV